jgi:hypothetical protein
MTSKYKEEMRQVGYGWQESNFLKVYRKAGRCSAEFGAETLFKIEKVEGKYKKYSIETEKK